MKVAALLAALIALPTLAGAAPRIDRSVVWSPSPSVADQLTNCHRMDCLQQIMVHAKAPRAAVNFTNQILGFGEDGEGYPDQFKAYGPVDLVRVFRPYYGMGGELSYFLVNGAPAIVDATDWNRISAVNLSANATFRRIKSHYPKVMVWAEPEFVAERKTPSEQTFVFQYVLLDGCHACDLLGSVRYGFSFGPDGLFTGVHIDGVSVGTPKHRSEPSPVRP